MTRQKLIAIAAAAACLVGIAVSVAQATNSGPNGPIAFSRYRFTDNPLRKEIWISNADGSGLRQVTHVGPNIVDTNPDWSPDGSRLVFTRCSPEDAGDRCTIWTVRADGSDQHILSPACGWTSTAACQGDDSAVYSPDGRRLVFSHGFNDGRGHSNSQIVVSDTRLRHQHVILDATATPDIGAFAWSPDGRRIAFEGTNDAETRRATYVIGVGGSGLHRLTPWGLHAAGGDRIDWSPDGTRILFRSLTSGWHGAIPRDGNVYTIRPDGTDVRKLTHLPPGTGLQLGSYSPDGKWIVFSTASRATPGGGPWPDVFVIRADGSGLAPVTRTMNWEGSPDWGPG